MELRLATAPVVQPDDRFHPPPSDEDVDADGSEAQDLIDRISLCAVDQPGFDTTFVDNLSEQLLEKGRLTSRQIM